jgi:hypothetical protein
VVGKRNGRTKTKTNQNIETNQFTFEVMILSSGMKSVWRSEPLTG